ncbi:RNA recognition motif domain-containing protein [Ditylenchus destructor]|uniref:RNA recognition motif domain-containing protein n=1 Tax=Ditylenchus destructor TaxID=166010 RepID=A0AAD4MY70_9BILA|nr:RNA recognition motif domain-containing protein [Ditylenchus destructor]
MIAPSRLVGNLLALHRCSQLTRVIGLAQSVRFQSTNGNADKNFTLKLPPNATGVSVEHSNEKSVDGTSLRVTLNISVLQSNKSAPESEQSDKLRAYSNFDLKGHHELKVTKNPVGDRTILIDGLSEEISKEAIQDYFSQFGDVELCRIPFGNQSAYVTFKSPKAVNHVLNCAPHYIAGDKITQEIPMAKEENETLQSSDPSKTRALEILRLENDEKKVIVRGLSNETSQEALRAYFSRFGVVDTCFSCQSDNCQTAYVGFKSPKTVNLVMERGPHYLIGDKIVDANEYDLEEQVKVNKRRIQKEEFPKNFNNSSSGPGKFDKVRTLIVAGLSKDTTEAALRAVFTKMNLDVTNCKIIQDQDTGASREFGFVELATVEEAKRALEYEHCIGKEISMQMSGNEHGFKFSIDRALNSQPRKIALNPCYWMHRIDNKVVYVEHAYVRHVDSPRSSELTLFVGNLSPETTDESLKQYFSKFGQLTQCEVKIDRKTGQSRGFGFVSFSSQKENESEHNFCDNTVLVTNLPKSATDEELYKIFSEFGQLTDWGVKSDGSYGWVSFARPIKGRTLEEKSPAMFGKKLDLEPVESMDW